MSFTFLREAICDFKAIGSPIPTLGMAVRLMVRTACLKEGDIVADAGAGTGVIALAAARAVGPSGHVVAVEMNEKLCEYTRRRVEEASLSDRITLVQGDAMKLGDYLRDIEGVPDRYDAILSSVPMTCLPDPLAYLKTLRTYTKSGGKLLQETYWPSKIRRLFNESGLEHINTSYTIITVAPGAIVSGTVPAGRVSEE